tara:strand:- start:40 stop:468 length:429 start_codon:yes stop_codon:yes gene_type:complete
MASFAKIGLNNKVIAVHSLHNDVLKDANGVEQEVNGIDFLTKLHGWAIWKQTFTDGKRIQPAKIGHIYDEDRDAFIEVKPSKYPSFVFNESKGNWHPPTSKIVDGVEVAIPPMKKDQVWDEATLSWVTDISFLKILNSGDEI